MKIDDFGETTDDFMRCVGAYLGDGYMRIRGISNPAKIDNGNISFAFPEGDKSRTKYIQLITKVFGHKPKENINCINLYQTSAAKLFDKIGLNCRARKKTIPDWVFGLPKTQKLALIEGLLDSDGWQDGDTYRIEMASKELIERLILLATDVGWITGNIQHRKRNVTINNGYRDYKYKDNESWTIRLHPPGKQLSVRVNAFKFISENFALNRIKKIQPKNEEEEVYDLEISAPHHNFIANDIIAHNCVAGGNVGNCCWSFAWSILKKNPVILIGIDLGYPEGTDLGKTSYYSSMHRVISAQLPEKTAAVATNMQYDREYNPDFKSFTFTDTVFKGYRKIWSLYLDMLPQNVITYNCTEGGAFRHPRLKAAALAETLKRFPT